MLKKVIHRFLRHRHFWREVGFDELSELYISMMFRSLSISLTGIFVPIYMLGLGYSVTDILMVIAWYFTFRSLGVDLIAAYTTAKIGPKHTMLIGYILQTVSTALFLTLPQLSWPIWLLGGIWGASASLFFIPFHVDFSKVKHTEHGGKELGFLTMMERVGSVLGPLVSGAVAFVFGPQYMFLVAIILLVIGIVPLFRTGEPVRTNQQIHFNQLDIKPLKRDFVSVIGLGIENTLSMYFWPLFLGVSLLSGRDGFALFGLISSVAFLAAIFSSRTIGKLIDDKQGQRLLRISTPLNALIHLARASVPNLPMALGLNIANEIVTPGYRIPYFKGLYDRADELPGFRIVYITSIELISSIQKASVWWILAILSTVLEPRSLFSLGFAIAAAASLLITTERFKALEPIIKDHESR